MASSREIYGYPKSVSTILRQFAEPSRPDLSIDTLHFPIFGSDQQAQTERIVEILRTNEPAIESTADDLSFETLISGIRKTTGVSSSSDAANIPLPSAGMPQVMLRQFRDVTRAGVASMKEILLVKPKPANFGPFGLIASDVNITVLPSASHNLHDTMGVHCINPVKYGVWLTFDFTVGWARKLMS
jgi:hypothetical protein